MTISTNFYTTNNQLLNLPHNTNFRGNPISIPQDKPDTVEAQGKFKTEKEKGLSTNAKIGIGLGVIATVVGGLLLHKNFANKVSSEGQQVTREFSQAVKNLINEGRISTKEAEMFDELKGLEGEEFITRAYDLVARDMGLTKYPKLIVDKTPNCPNLAHAGEDITVYLKSYERDFGNNTKEELLDFVRHELEHYKQSLIMFKQEGEEAYKEAFIAGKRYRIGDKARLMSEDSLGNIDRERWADNIETILNEEARKVGIAEPEESTAEIILERIFEHETPIKTIRSMTENDWANIHFSEEELSKAHNYLLSTRSYRSTDCFTQEYFLPNGTLDYDKIMLNPYAHEIMDRFYHEGYVQNPLEVGAKEAGETLRDKFIEFLRAINS